MSNPIKEVTFEIMAQGEPGRFSIVKSVLEALDISKDEAPALYLEIADAETGKILVPKDVFHMTSGTEILDSRTRATIKSYQSIRVTASIAG